MAKLLDGREVADFIKQRHYQTVRGMVRPPRLGIIVAGDDAASQAYAKAKQRYGSDIGAIVEVETVEPTTEALVDRIESLNQTADGVIVQLPLPADCDEDVVLAAIDPAKDVDGLTADSPFDPATPTGILWLLSSYTVGIKGRTVAVVGLGRLVGQPLSQMLTDSGAEVIKCDEHTKDLAKELTKADIIVTATGQAGLVKSSMVKPDVTVIDAGTSRVEGKLMGDADPSLFDRDDIAITPTPGGVGPMTVAALFDNLLRAATK